MDGTKSPAAVTPRPSAGGSASHRSRSAGSAVRALSWAAEYVGPRDEFSPSASSSPSSVAAARRLPPTEVPLMSIEELNCLDDISIGGSSGGVRLEHFDRGTAPTASTVASTGAPGSPVRADATLARGLKYLTPYSLRDPVTVVISGGHFVLKRPSASSDGGDTGFGAAGGKVLCSCRLDEISKIVRTVTGIAIVGPHGLAVGLSIHDDVRAAALYKLLHARARGAPPPTEVRPLTKPIVPRPRSESASRRSDDATARSSPALSFPTPRSDVPRSSSRGSRRASGVMISSAPVPDLAQAKAGNREARRQQLLAQIADIQRKR